AEVSQRVEQKAVVDQRTQRVGNEISAAPERAGSTIAIPVLVTSSAPADGAPETTNGNQSVVVPSMSKREVPDGAVADVQVASTPSIFPDDTRRPVTLPFMREPELPSTIVAHSPPLV